MTLWQRFLRVLGYNPPARLSFHADEDLLCALDEIAERENRRTAEIAHELLTTALIQRLTEDIHAKHLEALSPRERQVAGWIVRGYTDRQIAATLGVSPATIKVHVRNILHKFDVRNREELRRAFSHQDLEALLRETRLP